MRSIVFLLIFCAGITAKSQSRLCIDSMLLRAYEAKYGFHDGMMLIPYLCDPLCNPKVKKEDTAGLCGKFVFINHDLRVKVKPVFDLPCWFEPTFSEGYCGVAQKGMLVYLDSNGNTSIQTGLRSCSSDKHKLGRFNGGRARVYKGYGKFRHYYEVYEIDRSGKRIKASARIKVRIRPIFVSNEDRKDSNVIAGIPDFENNYPIPETLFFEMPILAAKGKYHLPLEEQKRILEMRPHRDNRMLLLYTCNEYQLSNMAAADTIYCGKWVFTDTQFNVKIGKGFTLPCSFEPEFAEGLCAVSVNNEIVYIDTMGIVRIRTGLKACDTIQNKASTFKNGIATLFMGDPVYKGIYSTIAINTNGERVRLLEFDELDLAEEKYQKFQNLTLEESKNCFVGKGKSNGIWFLIEKTGKVRKKLDLKRD